MTSVARDIPRLIRGPGDLTDRLVLPRGEAVGPVAFVLALLTLLIPCVVLAVVVPAATAEFLRLCSEYGNGVHEIGGTTVTLSGCPS